MSLAPGARRAGAVILLLVTAVLLASAPTHAGTSATTKIVVYGDSMTQGSSGDWTWRCRLWDHLAATAGSVDFVGPRADLKTWQADGFEAGPYPDPGCDHDHASKWGMLFSRSDYDLSELVQSYGANVLVGLIGLNDVLYGQLSPSQFVDKWSQEITQARADNPDVDFVLVPIPDTWYKGVTATNDALRTFAASADTERSRVVMAADPGWVKTRDTQDDSHPSANGEVLLAAVVGDALAEMGVGTPWPRPLSYVAPGPWFAPHPDVVADEQTMTVTWPLEEYANAERVWVRDLTARSDWEVSGKVAGTSWDRPVDPGHTYEVKLQPVKANLDGGTLSDVVTVRASARPDAATVLRARRLGGCRERLTWRPAQDATGYEVWLRDRRAGGWFLASSDQVTGHSFDTSPLRRHHRYVAFVRAFGPLRGADSGRVRFRACG